MLVTRRLGAIDVDKPIPWLWPGYIPAGKVVLIYGDGGLGKSTLGVDLAARVSTDGEMPDASQGMTGNVLVISVEDDEAFIGKRLTVAGADRERTNVIGIEQGFDFARQKDSLFDFIVANRTSLVVLDPLESIAGDINLNRANQVRDRLFTPLSDIMASTGCTCIVMHHTNKTDTNNASNKSSGNKAIVNASRAAYMVAPAVKGDGAVLLPVKSNMSKKMPSLLFQFEEDPAMKVGYVEWHGTTELTKDDFVDDATRGRGAPPRARLEAMAFIREFLSSGPRLVADVEAAATHIASRTLQRARTELGVIPLRHNGSNYIALPGKTEFTEDKPKKKPRKLKRRSDAQKAAAQEEAVQPGTRNPARNRARRGEVQLRRVHSTTTDQEKPAKRVRRPRKLATAKKPTDAQLKGAPTSGHGSGPEALQRANETPYEPDSVAEYRLMNQRERKYVHPGVKLFGNRYIDSTEVRPNPWLG